MKNGCRVLTKVQLLEEGYEPSFFEDTEKWENFLKLKYGVERIAQITAEQMNETLLPHQQNSRCSRSIYGISTKVHDKPQATQSSKVFTNYYRDSTVKLKRLPKKEAYVSDWDRLKEPSQRIIFLERLK